MNEALEMLVYGVAGFVGFVLFVVLHGGLLGAIWLRESAAWLGLSRMRYWTAFWSALLASFIVSVLGIVTGGAVAVAHDIDSLGYRDLWRLPVATDVMWGLAFGIFLTALVFRRTITQTKDGERLDLKDALALAALYYAISIGFVLLLGFFFWAMVLLGSAYR